MIPPDAVLSLPLSQIHAKRPRYPTPSPASFSVILLLR
jgi:hypothetical protein